ncbi:MAG: hypothetical protein PF447_03430 [Spirochaetaceae bacterium]|jgi:tetratricopeptide (TPR) repeat protein|nr:hypothetical protein [Spirochaetaceae bacterium]
MKKIILPVALLTILLSCTSLQDDLVHQSSSPEVFLELQEIENDLLLLTYPQEGTDLPNLFQRVNETLDNQQENSLNRQYLANLYSLRSWAAWLSKDNNSAKSWLDKAMEQDSREERVILVQAIITEDIQKALEGIEQVEIQDFYRLQVYKAWLLYHLGQYGEAVTLYDKAFTELPPIYGQIFHESRDLAWQLKDQEILGNAVDYLSDAPILMEEMVKRTLQESILLDGISRQNGLPFRQLYPLLQQRGFILENKPSQRQVDRGDAALFLWMLFIEKENHPEWQYKYSPHFDESPIEDLPLDSPYFDAVLGCVERELMSLPDGSYFYPGLLLSGLDYLEMLNRLKNY